MRTYEGSLWEFFVDELKRYDWHLRYLIGGMIAIASVAAVVFWVIFLIPIFLSVVLVVALIRCFYRAVFRMNASTIWFYLTYVLAIAAGAAIILRYYLPSDPMYVEMLATFLGVLFAISFGEGIRNGVEEKKAKLVQDDLVDEVREILENAERPFIRELTSATWISVRARGIPDRIEPELRKALAKVFELFEICNYSIRQKEEYSRAPNPDDEKMDILEFKLEDARNRLVLAARKVLEMVDS